MINAKMIAKMKRGAYLVNTARAKLVDRDAIVKALESGQLAGYAGDVWYPQPAPKDHPWRTMPHEGMTPHTSGSTLSAQARYSAGTREILECFYSGRPIREEYLIAQKAVWRVQERILIACANRLNHTRRGRQSKSRCGAISGALRKAAGVGKAAKLKAESRP